MDNIVVDPSSGDVGVSSMIQCANPDAHPGSILRSVHGVLKDVTSVPAMTKRSINQKSTVVAALATCNYILDNLPGRKWASWRQESGESFKSDLAEHVDRVRAGMPDEEPEEEFETKASVLEKSLRTIGIIVVDPSSGDVGVSSMIQCANPEAHPGSILRSVHGVLKDVTSVPAMTKRSIKQKSTIVAALATCNYILDNLPGRKWASWRQESGESFKRDLAEHVERVRAGIPDEDPDVADEEFETKASVLEKSLRTIGIIGSIRVDEASGKGSIIDVIKLLCPGATGDYATHALTRVMSRDDRLVSLASRISFIKINGKGQTTPVTDFHTMIEVLWMLPGRASRAFRRKAAHTICRVMGGDLELCDEIERNNNFWQSIEGGETVQKALIEPVEYNEEAPRRVGECLVRDALAATVEGQIEVRTPSGLIDVLSETEVIEVKYHRQWKAALGQVLAYGSHYAKRAKRLHLFAYAASDGNAHEWIGQARSVCDLYAVKVTLEWIPTDQELYQTDLGITGEKRSWEGRFDGNIQKRATKTWCTTT